MSIWTWGDGSVNKVLVKQAEVLRPILNTYAKSWAGCVPVTIALLQGPCLQNEVKSNVKKNTHC